MKAIDAALKGGMELTVAWWAQEECFQAYVINTRTGWYTYAEGKSSEQAIRALNRKLRSSPKLNLQKLAFQSIVAI